MTTPIHDLVRRYAGSNPSRLHMPGHKGASFLGCEPWDITEIDGADDLYDPQGIIRESQSNAARLFGSAATLYSTEGSSQCIRAMLYLTLMARAGGPASRPLILAGRNAHKAFLTAAALLDLDVCWLYPQSARYSLCRCDIPPAYLDDMLTQHPGAAAVYLTSPDYLGNTADIRSLAEVSRRHHVPLLVDNAHGAYLRFLSPSLHPLDLGADLCCDSAHKTLPVLTGGAYLHISRRLPPVYAGNACQAMSMFGSTSPSYLILQSLDLCNLYLDRDYPQKLAEAIQHLTALKSNLSQENWRFAGDEPLKLTISTLPSGYTGPQLAGLLQSRGIHPEYADPGYLVLMPSPETPPKALARLESALAGLPQLPPGPAAPPAFQPPQRRLTIRQALLSPSERLSLSDSIGRTLTGLSVSCPPAVAPAVPGEVLTEAIAEVYRYYGVETVSVVKN